MTGINRAAAAVAVLLVSTAAALAQVALVEDVNSKSAGVEFMDYVPMGKEIRLGARDTLVLSYLKSCWREKITGGIVTVGTEQSDVQNGKVERSKANCDGGKMMLALQQAGQSAGMVVRDLKPRPQTVSEPQVTLYGLSPVIEIKGGGTLLIERIDQPGERFNVVAGGPQLVRGAFYDFARAGKALAPGGIYRVSAGGRQIVFRIDPQAQPGPSPVVGRLLRLFPAT